MPLSSRDDVQRLKGVGPAYAAALSSAGVCTVGDLLLHFPVDYLDCRREAGEFLFGSSALYSGRVVSLGFSRNFRRRLSTLRLDLDTPAGRVRALVFNQPWWQRQLRRGKRIWAYGRVKGPPEAPVMPAPRLFLEAPEAVVPVYRELGGISRGRMGMLVRRALEETLPEPDFLPGWIRDSRALPGWREGLERVHAPRGDDSAALTAALERFRYTEFLEFHLELQLVRRHLKAIPRRFSYLPPPDFRPRVEERLGFRLTPGQAGALEEIRADLSAPVAMQRLVQGDVGSGKTAVAFACLLAAALEGFQAAFLAPTDMLARQHAQRGERMFADLETALLTGSTPAAERRRLEKEIAAGTVRVVFGTHALLGGRLRFSRLAMVVIDEQQRFGVSQRAALYCKGEGADLLVTTATPIPRTLMLAAFNDLSVSTIPDRPGAGGPIRTQVLDAGRREEFYGWLEERLRNKREAGDAPDRVFVVFPRIRAMDPQPDVACLEVEGAELQARLRTLGAAMISGETPAPRRERILADFRSGKLRVLIATTIVELGIDVPDATIMVIENADRFGLAQLHQLRGRVGRGDRPGRCYLIRSDGATSRGVERLEIMAREHDGFRLAEKDLEMRGGGEVAGQRQAGSLDFRFGDPARDHREFLAAREDAARILAGERELTPWLRERIAAVEARIHKIHFS